MMITMKIFSRKRSIPFICYLLVFLLKSFSSAAQNDAKIILSAGDDFFVKKNWSAAREKYRIYLSDTSKNALTWGRLGYCDQNLGFYCEALANYNKVLRLNSAPFLKPVTESRISRTYCLLNNKTEAIRHLDSAVAAGYSNLAELDTCREFNLVRNETRFKDLYNTAYNIAYPCTTDSSARKFDFWVGEWDVYNHTTNLLVGQSSIQKISGGCAILENYSSTLAPYSGKSINYYDGAKGKWEQDWVGSSGVKIPSKDVQRYVGGEYRDSAMRFTYQATKSNQDSIGNFIFYNLGPDKVRQYQDISTDSGKTYQPVYDLIYIRKKKAM
jgi:tetratricopeptide (TPR) repeat protein